MKKILFGLDIEACRMCHTDDTIIGQYNRHEPGYVTAIYCTHCKCSTLGLGLTPKDSAIMAAESWNKRNHEEQSNESL